MMFVAKTFLVVTNVPHLPTQSAVQTKTLFVDFAYGLTTFAVKLISSFLGKHVKVILLYTCVFNKLRFSRVTFLSFSDHIRSK